MTIVNIYHSNDRNNKSHCEIQLSVETTAGIWLNSYKRLVNYTAICIAGNLSATQCKGISNLLFNPSILLLWEILLYPSLSCALNFDVRKRQTVGFEPSHEAGLISICPRRCLSSPFIRKLKRQLLTIYLRSVYLQYEIIILEDKY